MESEGGWSGALSQRERHLAKRLEGFGDVVFGFAIAQLALQLDLPKTPRDLYAHPIKYVLYFVTFALLALLWLAFHRLLSGPYKPAIRDLFVTFAYLAFVGLVPYAMYANVHFAGKPDSAPFGLATYLICGFGTSSTASTIAFRNLMRGRKIAEASELRIQWRIALSFSCVAVVMIVALAGDLIFGGLVAPALLCLLVGTRLVVRRFPLPVAWLAPAESESTGSGPLRATPT